MESNDSRRAAGTLVLLVADRNDSEGGRRGGGGGFKAPSESYQARITTLMMFEEDATSKSLIMPE